MSATLIESTVHREDEIALYVSVGGKLVDPFLVEYQVFDASDAFPGDLVLPASGRQAVALGSPGNFDVGCYGVYDEVEEDFWAPLETMKRGRVRWYYTLEEGGREQVVERSFEVLADSIAVDSRQSLVLVQDLRDAGVSTSYTDRALYLLIGMWTERVTRYCRQSLLPVRESKTLSVRVGTSVMLPSQIHAFASMRLDGDSADYSATDLRISNEMGNPSIDFFAGYRDFPSGGKTLAAIDAVWGLINPKTMGAPLDVELATPAILARILKSRDMVASGPVGPMKREKTDAHEVEYSTISSEVRTGLSTYVKSQEMRDLLDMYRAPIAIAMTGWS